MSCYLLLLNNLLLQNQWFFLRSRGSGGTQFLKISCLTIWFLMKMGTKVSAKCWEIPSEHVAAQVQGKVHPAPGFWQTVAVFTPTLSGEDQSTRPYPVDRSQRRNRWHSPSSRLLRSGHSLWLRWALTQPAPECAWHHSDLSGTRNSHVSVIAPLLHQKSREVDVCYPHTKGPQPPVNPNP